jgi:Ser/Thr protein kinase RdoA (MazF antagonist)
MTVPSARPDVGALVARWAGDPRTVAHIRDGENAVYRFATADGARILRLTAVTHRSREALEAELDFIRFVTAGYTSRSFEVARPVTSVSGSWVEAVGHDASATSWHAVAFEEARGCIFEFFSPDIDRPLFLDWGRAMGTLHSASRAFTPEATRRRPEWTAQAATRCDVDGLPSDESAARREHASVVEWLAHVRAPNEHRGLIHGDFERTNFVLDGESLRLYDFDDACYHWYVADIAHALWAFRNAPAADRARFLGWFLEGYRERAPIADELLADFSWFIRLRSLSLFLRRVRLRATDSRRAADDPWEQRMRVAFERPFRW